MEEARWEFAWCIFDDINDDLNDQEEIDLKCLDIEEAKAIAK